MKICRLTIIGIYFAFGALMGLSGAANSVNSKVIGNVILSSLLAGLFSALFSLTLPLAIIVATKTNNWIYLFLIIYCGHVFQTTANYVFEKVMAKPINKFSERFQQAQREHYTSLN